MADRLPEFQRTSLVDSWYEKGIIGTIQNPYYIIAQGLPLAGRYNYPTQTYQDLIFKLFIEMVDKDPHLRSTIFTRIKSVIARSREVLPFSSKRQDKKIADFVKGALNKISHFEDALVGALFAPAFGISYLEIIWGLDDNGYIVPKELRHKWPGSFTYDEQLKLKYYKRSATGFVSTVSEYAPANKFITVRHCPLFDAPFGSPLLITAFWYFFFKNGNMKFWVRANERWGQPIVIGKLPSGCTDEEKQGMKNILEKFANAGYLMTFGDQTIDTLDVNNFGSLTGTSFQNLCEYCDKQITKLFVGGALAIDEGTSTGSRALGEVHETVRFEYTESDARMVNEAFNQQLIKPLVEYNFGKGANLPTWQIDVDKEEDKEKTAKFLTLLIDMGVPLKIDWIYEKYGIPVPQERDRVLKYDSLKLFANLVESGALTINEIRKSLGQPEVEWGNLPASAMKNSRAISELQLLGVTGLSGDSAKPPYIKEDAGKTESSPTEKSQIDSLKKGEQAEFAEELIGNWIKQVKQ